MIYAESLALILTQIPMAGPIMGDIYGHAKNVEGKVKRLCPKNRSELQRLHMFDGSGVENNPFVDNR